MVHVLNQIFDLFLYNLTGYILKFFITLKKNMFSALGTRLKYSIAETNSLKK